MNLPAAVAVLCLSLVIVGGDPVSAREKPDFSGVWPLKTPPELPPDAAHTVVVNQTATKISIERRFAGRTTSENHQLSRTGGTVGASGATSFQGVMWFGDRLLFHEETRSGPAGTHEKYYERGEDWSLDADGVLTVETTIRRSDAPRSRTILTYTRQAEARIRRSAAPAVR